MFILGISCFYHDAAAALIRDGQLVAAVEEERLTRRKHDSDFPMKSVEFCLREAGITADELDYVVFYEKPILKFHRVFSSVANAAPFSWNLFKESVLSWFSEKLWMKGLLRDRLALKDENRILFSEHHLSHAASAFYCSPYEEAAILTVDAVGEWTTATLGTGNGTNINLTHQLEFPHSLGLLYSAFTNFLGFEVNDGEYKVMGLAAYGQPRFLDKLAEVASIGDDGSIRLNMKYFAFHRSTEKAFNQNFEKLFGNPRTREQSETLEQYYCDLAASIQRYTEEALIKMAGYSRAVTNQKNLCMAGGVALNGIANYRILKESGFEHLYVQPAATDAGGALGAALWAYHMVLGKPRKYVMDHTYYGPSYADSDIADCLAVAGLNYREASNQEQLIATVTDRLESGGVVAWYQGKTEWGPRALGNRSILADPRRSDMKDIVNRKIKFREPFRPFAPSVLVNDAHRYFEINDPETHYPARFMLYVTPVIETQRESIPAVTHVDGTARIQVVHPETNPLYHELISSFGQATGLPMVLNTSLNLRGEPIANSPSDAVNTFNGSEMDLLVMNNFICEKRRP